MAQKNNPDNERKYKYEEPPELRKAGVPPLRKIINGFTIGIVIALLIVLGFALYFYFSNS